MSYSIIPSLFRMVELLPTLRAAIPKNVFSNSASFLGRALFSCREFAESLSECWRRTRRVSFGSRSHRGTSTCVNRKSPMPKRSRIVPDLRSLLAPSVSAAVVSAVEPTQDGGFMSLPLMIHVPALSFPKPAIFGLLKAPPKPLLLAPARAPWLTKKPAQFALEYENPDLSQPSVSSF
jgi:hypothetical protein